jgi:hypothetical protein
MTEKKDEAEEPQVEEAEQVPDPGPAPAVEREPLPPEPTEEEQEKAAEEQKEAEDAARKAAEDQPEDPSVEAKSRQPVLVLKEQFDAEWPTVEAQFPGVEPEFGKEEDGYVELLNAQAPSMAYATSCAPPVQVRSKAERTQHGWDDFVDNSHPEAEGDEDEDGDIEAKPKRRRQVKVQAGS